MNIALILERNASKFGDRTAIVDRGRRISFAALDRAASCAAGELAQAGLSRGMRALVFSPMSIDLYTTVIGLFRLGVTAVFVDPSAGATNLAACIARVRADAFVAVPRAHLLRLTSAAVRGVRIKVAIGDGIPAGRCVWRRRVAEGRGVEPCGHDTPAIITFTSGTTGEPKAVVRSHGFLVAQYRALVESLALELGETDLTTLPIFLLANLAAGVTSVIPDGNLRTPGSIDPAPVLEQVRTERPTRTVASPALLGRLVDHAAALGERLDSFERIFTGGAPIFPRTLDAIAAAAPRAAVVALYGSTEAEPIAAIDRRDISPADRHAMRRGAGLLAGKPAPSIQVRILRGEIVVSGEHVVRGYLDDVGNEDTKIPVGNRVWHRTGDSGYFDSQGRLWLLGRCSAKVEDRGGVLHPFAVECAASEVPGVGRSALIQHRGRRVLVVEVDRDGGALRELLLRRLAWARLDDVVGVSRIPVDLRHNAKVDLPALTRLLSAV